MTVYRDLGLMIRRRRVEPEAAPALLLALLSAAELAEELTEDLAGHRHEDVPGEPGCWYCDLAETAAKVGRLVGRSAVYVDGDLLTHHVSQEGAEDRVSAAVESLKNIASA